MMRLLTFILVAILSSSYSYALPRQYEKPVCNSNNITNLAQLLLRQPNLMVLPTLTGVMVLVEKTQVNDTGELPNMARQVFQDAIKAAGYDLPQDVDSLYDGFVKGAKTFNLDGDARELAMILAHILWETDGFQYIIERPCADAVPSPCRGRYVASQDVPNQDYYGRGYLQLTWSFNYAAASSALYNDDRLLQNPDLVSSDLSIAWLTSFWFWSARVHDTDGVQLYEFGLTTRAINGGLECDGRNTPVAKARFANYVAIANSMGLTGNCIETGCYN